MSKVLDGHRALKLEELVATAVLACRGEVRVDQLLDLKGLPARKLTTKRFQRYVKATRL